MENEIQEMSYIQRYGAKGIGMSQYIKNLILFLLSVCYKRGGNEEKREDLLEIMSVQVELYCLNDQEDDICYRRYACILLMFDVFENSAKWKHLHYKIYKKSCLTKLDWLMKNQKRENLYSIKLILVEHLLDVCLIIRVTTLLCSCNVNTVKVLKILNDCLKISGMNWVEELMSFEHTLPYLCQQMLTEYITPKFWFSLEK